MNRRQRQQLAPGALLVNFTNPAGLVTQALHQAGFVRSVGIGDSANHAQNDAAHWLKVAPDRVKCEVFGLNHLSWASRIWVDGTDRLPELLADSEGAIFMETNRSWSIDDRRYNFQFGTEVGYEIRGGKLGRLLRNCTYTGITPEFWNSCDAVCDASQWTMYGTPNCGKGQPGQQMHTGHGASPARFRNTRIGVLG